MQCTERGGEKGSLNNLSSETDSLILTQEDMYNYLGIITTTYLRTKRQSICQSSPVNKNQGHFPPKDFQSEKKS